MMQLHHTRTHTHRIDAQTSVVNNARQFNCMTSNELEIYGSYSLVFIRYSLHLFYHTGGSGLNLKSENFTKVKVKETYKFE